MTLTRRLLLAYGVDFGVEAGLTALREPPQEALEKVAKLIADLRNDMCERIGLIRSRA